MFDRLTKIIDEKSFAKIKNLNILLVGVGGVGGYALETLVRMGINNITIVDYDKVYTIIMNDIKMISNVADVERLIR